MTKQTLREVITKAVVDQIEDNTWTFDEAMDKWWMNIRREGGLRLSEMGDLSFRYAKIEFFIYDFSIGRDSSWQLFILDMNNKIKCPYYIGVNKLEKKAQPYIRLYDSKIAMMINLYGNLNDYLKSVRIK